MRVLAAIALLAVALTGCVGNFTNDNFSPEHIEARYARCLASYDKSDGMSYGSHLGYCAYVRDYDKDYRVSLRRFFGDITGGGTVDAPTSVIILN